MQWSPGQSCYHQTCTLSGSTAWSGPVLEKPRDRGPATALFLEHIARRRSGRTWRGSPGSRE
jgi:hypothetical protein